MPVRTLAIQLGLGAFFLAPAILFAEPRSSDDMLGRAALQVLTTAIESSDGGTITAARAASPNLTAAYALPLQIRQPVRTTMNDSEEERWFLLEFRAGRSYCVETGNNNDERPEVSIAIYANAEGTDAPAASSSMTAGEPLATLLARACFIASASGPHAVKVTAPLAAPYVSSLFLRVVETTVWSSWFFQGGDYNSFVLLRNTTNIPVSFTVTWRTADGTVAGTSGPQVVPPDGGVGLRSGMYVPKEFINGTVEIAHDGSPDALIGQMTSLSALTGLGFDAKMFSRVPW